MLRVRREKNADDSCCAARGRKGLRDRQIGEGDVRRLPAGGHTHLNSTESALRARTPSDYTEKQRKKLNSVQNIQNILTK